MELQDIWQQFTTLPPDAQQEVADFIVLLKQRKTRQSQSQPQLNQQNLREESFIGLWQEREDLQDSTQWVRAIRSSEWLS